MHELERALAEITPRAATVTLLLFDEVVERYEREKGFPLSEEEKKTILSVLRYIVTRECGANVPGSADSGPSVHLPGADG